MYVIISDVLYVYDCKWIITICEFIQNVYGSDWRITKSELS